MSVYNLPQGSAQMVDINLTINKNHKSNENYTAGKNLNCWCKKDCDLMVFRVS